MTALESIRGIIYWSNDIITGNLLRKHLREIYQYYQNYKIHPGESEQRVDSLLNHAVRTVPFYSHYADRQSLADFPIITKQQIKERYNDFISNAYNLSDLKTGHTSGSYGSPFTFYFTKDNKARQTAELIYFNHMVGFKVGMKHANFASRKKSSFEQFKQNQIVVHPAKMDISWCEYTWNELRHSGIKVIVGYPSALIHFGEFISHIKDRKNFHPLIIISIAEPLYDEQHRYLEDVYGCPVVGRYAATETGVIAYQTTKDTRYFVNTLRLLLEVIDPITGEHVARGGRGKVLITDLYSDAMPLIRYDIGDIVTLSDDPANESGVRILDRIEGRAVETIIAPNGSYISPIAIDDVFDGFIGIHSFRFIQNTETEFEVELVTNEKYLYEQQLLDGFKRLLGPRANISFKYIDEIPPLPSGKRPFIINEMLRKKAGGG
jgi:phenylacetate-CoA ligase